MKKDIIAIISMDVPHALLRELARVAMHSDTSSLFPKTLILASAKVLGSIMSTLGYVISPALSIVQSATLLLAANYVKKDTSTLVCYN